MDVPSWLSEGEAHVWRPYCQHRTAPPPFAVVSARGSRLILADGRELVDGTASWWTASHGYGHPHIAARVRQQLERLPHVAFGGLAHEAAYTLARRLAGLLPSSLGRAFFVESGSVAVEVALKMALQSFHNRGLPQRRRVVAFEGGYHGDTFATMSLCDPHDGLHRAFAGMGVERDHLALPFEGDDGAFERSFERIGAEVACVIVEPLVQCAGGMRFHSSGTLQRIHNACKVHGALLVLDEIATGFYRTGARFAFEEAGVVPDILTLGKALTGGTLPLAVTMASEEVFHSFLGEAPDLALQHGPTYMANALACAAAHASLDLFERGEMSSTVRALEARLQSQLARLAGREGVRDVRVRGAIAAVEMARGTAPASAVFAEHGAFIRPLRLRNADVVYLMPPLVIDEPDLAVLCKALDRSLPGGD